MRQVQLAGRLILPALVIAVLACGPSAPPEAEVAEAEPEAESTALTEGAESGSPEEKMPVEAEDVEPSEPEPGQVLVAVSPPVAAQFALHEAMRAEGVTATELARRVGMRPSRARRLTDIFRPAMPGEIERALAAVGLHMISEAAPLEQWTPSPEPAPAL